jgi:hypothetical protein
VTLIEFLKDKTDLMSNQSCNEKREMYKVVRGGLYDVHLRKSELCCFLFPLLCTLEKCLSETSHFSHEKTREKDSRFLRGGGGWSAVWDDPLSIVRTVTDNVIRGVGWNTLRFKPSRMCRVYFPN